MGLPADVVNLVPGTDHASVKALLRLRGLVDVVIPRGGAGLIRTVVEESTVPVIETGVGNCHVYVDADADLEMAAGDLLNAKTQRPGVCNAAETLLVHRAVAARSSCGMLCRRSARRGRHRPRRPQRVRGVRAAVRAGDRRRLGQRVPVARPRGARSSTSCRRRSSTSDAGAAGTPRRSSRARSTSSQAFVAGCDSAAVMVNASTRFTDGEQLGMGAEIGISTQKLHARGPMGLAELTSTKWVVTGDGHIREWSARGTRV